MSNLDDLANRFTHHPPVGDQTERYAAIRKLAHELALVIQRTTPASREQSLAYTKLEEVVFWANAAIARHDTP